MQETEVLSPDTYHEDVEYIGKSGLDLIDRSPKHFWERYLNPDAPRRPQTPAQVIGSLVHCVLLEPQKFERRYQLIPPDMNKRTGAWAEWKAANEGKTWVEEEDYAAALAIREAVHSHPHAALLLAEGDGVAEKPMWAHDPETGVLVKSKPDFHNTKLGFIVDVKTTTDAREAPFARDIYNYRYHVQDAFYTDVATWSGVPVRGFAFVVVEKEPPYGVAVYILDDDSRELGRMAYRENLNTYAACLKSGVWHGYEAAAKSLRLPPWAFR